MKLPRNRFSLLSALWFAGGIYSLLFKAADTAPPTARTESVYFPQTGCTSSRYILFFPLHINPIS
ncbi:hypothetical protein I7P99_00065 [Neisseria meningitidis]|nr:hypothetical protein [Neisseria meningitidis]MBH6073945.1 hypothetical protein [Neisseria meningitidis]MBH6079589.1 hypothetical protein [Neisseria meningitidis]